MCLKKTFTTPASAMLLFSSSVVFDSLRPGGLQHARLPCPSLSPGVCSSSCPLSQWCHLTISSSAALFSFGFHSFAASGSFPRSWLRYISTLFLLMIFPTQQYSRDCLKKHTKMHIGEVCKSSWVETILHLLWRKSSSGILVQLPPAKKSSQCWDEPGHWGCPHHLASGMDCGLTRYYR